MKADGAIEYDMFSGSHAHYRIKVFHHHLEQHGHQHHCKVEDTTATNADMNCQCWCWDKTVSSSGAAEGPSMVWDSTHGHEHTAAEAEAPHSHWQDASDPGTSNVDHYVQSDADHGDHLEQEDHFEDDEATSAAAV
jgi:hypothetical protein